MSPAEMPECASRDRVALHGEIQIRLWGLIETGYEYSRHSVEFATAFVLGGQPF